MAPRDQDTDPFAKSANATDRPIQVIAHEGRERALRTASTQSSYNGQAALADTSQARVRNDDYVVVVPGVTPGA